MVGEVILVVFQNGEEVEAPDTYPVGNGISALEFNPNGANAPIVSYVDGFDLFDFDNVNSQEVWAMVKVPSSYPGGTPIIMKGLSYFCNVNSGNVLMRAITYLMKSATSILGTYTNSHTSTNTEKTQTVSSRLEVVDEIQLTDASGMINGVAVAAGDVLRVKLFRNVGSETSPAAADVRMLQNSCAISFFN